MGNHTVFDECKLSFLKTHKCKFIPISMRKTAWLLFNNHVNMKNLHGGAARRSFFKSFFFLQFCTKTHPQFYFGRVLDELAET